MKGYSFKCLWATLPKIGTCNVEICTRIATFMAAMARMERIWKINISLQVKLKLSVPDHPLSLWDFDTSGWGRKKDPGVEKKILEKSLPHFLLGAQNHYVGSKIKRIVDRQESLSATTKRRNRSWFRHGITHSARRSRKALLRVDTVGDGKRKAGQVSRIERIWQCWNSWERLTSSWRTLSDSTTLRFLQRLNVKGLMNIENKTSGPKRTMYE